MIALDLTAIVFKVVGWAMIALGILIFMGTLPEPYDKVIGAILFGLLLIAGSNTLTNISQDLKD